MFYQRGNQDHLENVCWLIPPQKVCNGPRYRSPFASKVRCDNWAEKTGCCRTIGPPPKVTINCPDHFLKKHSRQVPVFFSPEELRVKKQEEDRKVVDEPVEFKGPRLPPLNTGLPSWRTHRPLPGDCEYPRPPSHLGFFRHHLEPSYEKRYKIKRPLQCDCDELLWQDLVRATQCAGVMAAEMEKRERRRSDEDNIRGPPKDYIRANAIRAIRMPPKRLRRCYVDSLGVHLIDMSDSPYVLRPGFGKVPSYICRRKMELLEQDLREKEEMKQEALGNVRHVPDMEREAVILGLKEYWGELLSQYNSLPLNYAGNERHRELKASLEVKMKEVEADLRLLNSTSMLFVSDDCASAFS